MYFVFKNIIKTGKKLKQTARLNSIIIQIVFEKCTRNNSLSLKFAYNNNNNDNYYHYLYTFFS